MLFGSVGDVKLTSCILAATVTLLLFPTPASAKLKRFAEAHAKGDQASAQAAGPVRRPAKIVVKVKTEPEQEVVVEWSMTCFKRSKEASSDGTFTEPTPVRRTLYMPLRKPKSCDVQARSELVQSGTLYIALFKKRRS
jgi:hypothetical protein